MSRPIECSEGSLLVAASNPKTTLIPITDSWLFLMTIHINSAVHHLYTLLLFGSSVHLLHLCLLFPSISLPKVFEAIVEPLQGEVVVVVEPLTRAIIYTATVVVEVVPTFTLGKGKTRTVVARLRACASE
jgi:hypothetical protein